MVGKSRLPGVGGNDMELVGREKSMTDGREAQIASSGPSQQSVNG